MFIKLGRNYIRADWIEAVVDISEEATLAKRLCERDTPVVTASRIHCISGSPGYQVDGMEAGSVVEAIEKEIKRQMRQVADGK